MSLYPPHVRRRLPRSGGNQFYKGGPVGDRHLRTCCGAPITDRDLAWQDGKTKWAKANACPACLAAYDPTEVRS